MMMKPAPTPALEMSQPQFLLQFFVVAFDDPTLLGQTDQILDFHGDGQGRQPILRGLGFAFRPLEQQPLFGTRLGALFIPVRRTDTQQSKSRTEPMFRAFSPSDVFPRLFRQTLRQRQYGDGGMIRIASQALGRLSSAAPGLLGQRSFS